MNDRPSLPYFQLEYKWKLIFLKSLRAWCQVEGMEWRDTIYSKNEVHWHQIKDSPTEHLTLS